MADMQSSTGSTGTFKQQKTSSGANVGGRSSEGVGSTMSNIQESIEQYATDFRSENYFTFAIASMAVSALLQVTGRKEDAMFIGQWAPSLLALAIYHEVKRDREPTVH